MAETLEDQVGGTLRLRRFFLPAALAISAASGAGATFEGGYSSGGTSILGYGPAAGALVIGREDLVRVRASLGRISDELHLILGVLDQHLEAPQAPNIIGSDYGPAGVVHHGQFHLPNERSEAVAAALADYMPLPRPRSLHAEQQAAAAPPQVLTPPPTVEPPQESWLRVYLRAIGSFLWAVISWLISVGIFALDIGIVVGMQLFLESIGRKRGGGSSIMARKGATNAMTAKNGVATPTGAPIPTPSTTPGGVRTQRLSVLSQEEFLAAILTEHWIKVAVGFALAVTCRLPQYILSSDSLTCHMLVNLSVMLRCMSLVMLLLRDDMTLPKKDREKVVSPMMPPSSGSEGFHPAMAADIQTEMSEG